MQKRQIWISPQGNSWKIHKSGASKASHIVDTKTEAIKRGTAQAKREHSELISQKRNGQINLKNSYGNDPYPPKG